MIYAIAGADANAYPIDSQSKTAQAEKTLPVGRVNISLRIDGFTPASAIATDDDHQVNLKKTAEGLALSLDTLGANQLIIIG